MANEEELEVLAELFFDSDSEYEFEGCTDKNFVGTRDQASGSTSVLQYGAFDEGSDTDDEDSSDYAGAPDHYNHMRLADHVCQRTCQHPWHCQ